MLDLTRIPEGDLAQFVTQQSWFRSRIAVTVPARVVEVTELRTTPPLLHLALVDIGVEHGRSELYQLPIGLRPAGDRWTDGVIASLADWVAYDALADPELSRELIGLVTAGGSFRTGETAIEFVPAVGVPRRTSTGAVVSDLELSVYRRLDAGTHPELELLRFLNGHGFANAPTLAGWYSYSSRLIDATLGVVYQRVNAESDGWTFARESLADEPERFLAEVGRLGAVTGAMHVLLASEPADPDFAPEDPSADALGLFEATLDEEIESLFAALPDDEALAPIAGRGEEVRESLRQLSRTSGSGRVIRLHGDLHLGTVARTGSDWMLLGFGGEARRSMAERRRKQSPLRDVASMLRSFAYAARTATLDFGTELPPDWEERARTEFLSGYFSQIETAGLVPGGIAANDRLLMLFELERAVHELRYEVENRPEWVPIPVAAIAQLLELQVALAG